MLQKSIKLSHFIDQNFNNIHSNAQRIYNFERKLRNRLQNNYLIEG
jgi:hypothetical protein